LLWKFAPGAAALRVPQRINLVLNIGVVIVCIVGLEALRRTSNYPRALVSTVTVLLGAALVAEQLNFMPTHLISRSEEARKFSRVPPPPKNCSEFFVSNWASSVSGMLTRQTDAMLVAQRYDIPTINGYSSWFPNGWGMMSAARGQLSQSAAEWAQLKGISSGLCSLDMKWGVWRPVDLTRALPVTEVSQHVDGEVQDGGFEDDDLESWDPFQDIRAAADTVKMHSGLRSLAEFQGTGSAYQDISGLKPGQPYRITAWVSGSPGATAGARIAAYDPLANAVTFSGVAHPGTQWQPLAHTFTLGKYSTTIRIHLFRTEGSGTIYWDDINIEPDNRTDNVVTKQ
jgi:hypothetical protein